MKIELSCTCGNKAELQVIQGGNLVLRDNLERYRFRVDRENDNCRTVRCKCCNREWITLDFS